MADRSTACPRPWGTTTWRTSRDANAPRGSRGPAPVHLRAEIAAFVAGTKDGEFDDFLD